MFAPGGSPLHRTLVDWVMYSHRPMSKEQLGLYCNTVWPKYILEREEIWPRSGSLNYCTIMQLELLVIVRTGYIVLNKIKYIIKIKFPVFSFLCGYSKHFNYVCDYYVSFQQQ